MTDDTPKPLLKFKDKPILERNLENLPPEIDEVVFVIGYLGGQIRAFMRTQAAQQNAVFVQQNEPSGTGAALHLCKNILREQFLVINGDDLYSKKDLSRLLSHKLAVLGFWSKSWRGTSLVLDEGGNLAGIENHAPEHEIKIANCGAYLLDQSFFNYPLVEIKRGVEFSLPHTLVSMSRDHKIFVEKASNWKHINAPLDLK